MNEKQKEEIIQGLEGYVHRELSQKPKYGIYINNVPIYFYNGKNIYSSIGVAKRKILENCIGWLQATHKTYPAYREALDALIEEGIIQIKPII